MRFEEHYFACAQCQEELAAAHGLRRGLQVAAAQDLSQIQAQAAAQQAARQQGILAWLQRRSSATRGALAALLLAVVILPSALLLTRPDSPGPAGSTGSPAAQDVVLLTDFRGAAEPSATLTHQQAAEAVTLAVDPGANARFVAYGARVLDAQDQPLFTTNDLHLTDLEVLLLRFPAGFLTPGDYTVEISGIEADGSRVELLRHTIRVLDS